jgi:heterodisulfide reductase subunit B
MTTHEDCTPHMCTGPAVTPCTTCKLLNADEHRAMDLSSDLINLVAKIAAHGGASHYDMAEMVAHLHAIQNAILGQAAARAYPARYRALGQSFR